MKDQDYKKYKVYVAPKSVKNPLGKTGCTVDMSRIRNQDAEVIFDTDDIMMASMVELSQQLIRGHKVDSIPYHLLPAVTGTRDMSQVAVKGISTRIKNGTLNSNPVIQEKIKATKIKNGTTNSNTPESIKKRKVTLERNGTKFYQTPESIAKQLETKERNGTTNSTTPESIEKCKATKIKNGTESNCHSPESIAKSKATRIRNGTKGDHSKGFVSARNIITGTTSKVSKEDFDKYDFLVGTTSKVKNLYKGTK